MGTSWYSLSQMLLQMGRYSNPSLRNGDQGTRIIDPNPLSSGFTMLFNCGLNICLSNAVRLGHMTCFGQWNVSIFDMKRCLKQVTMV